MRGIGRNGFGLRWVAGLVVACLVGLHALAGTERFDYDSLGRLVRHIDPSGTVTEYIYDAVGNILEVRRSGAAGPPIISSVTPASIRRRESLIVQVDGAQLTGARITPPDASLDVSGLRTSPARVSFTLTTSVDAALGSRPFALFTSTGSAPFALTVNPALPLVTTSPALVILPPAGVQEVTLRLSNGDVLPHSIALGGTNPAVATVTPALLLLAPGQTEARFTVAAVALGVTRVDLTSTTLSGFPLGIHIVTPPAGDNARYAANVGVVRPQVPGGGAPAGPFAAANVGVTRPAAPGGGAPVGPFAAANVGVVRPAAPGGGAPVGPFTAANVGVTRPAAPGGGAPIGPFTAANVGVVRPAAPGGGARLGPFTAANVGVLRPAAPGSGGVPFGPLTAPNVGALHE